MGEDTAFFLIKGADGDRMKRMCGDPLCDGVSPQERIGLMESENRKGSELRL